MTLGSIGFLQPLLLVALIGLPAIWWLLRFTPPRPAEVAFPPIRLLLGLRSHQETPARSPWWLTALRILIAALVILALAAPVLDPQTSLGVGRQNLLIVLDNGWGTASRWTPRQNMIASLLQQAEGRQQTVRVVTTAGVTPGGTVIEPLSPAKAREKVASLEPLPFASDRAALAATLDKALPDAHDYDVVWLTDGLADQGAAQLASVLRRLSGGRGFTVLTDVAGSEALGLSARSNIEKGLVARITAPVGKPRTGRVVALSGRGARLAEVPFDLAGGMSAEVVIDLPLELRNQVTRLEIDGEASAGATFLLDGRSLWQRFGVISGESHESAQPLLSPTHYIERALMPYGEVVLSNTGNVERGTDALLERSPSVLLFANIGQLTGDSETKLRAWVGKGGVLIRFAGPRLEKGGDSLLPVPLREGGRTLGGAMSWRTPQKLAPFEETSPFYGLAVPEDVLVNRQVLADPAGLQDANVQIWARLTDGTPLVTASRLANGWLVLFHVNANSDWSNLPMSGLFVEMLRRTAELSNVSTSAANGNTAGTEQKSAETTMRGTHTAFLIPWRTLDGYGRLGLPPVTSNALPVNQPDILPGPGHPPGYYGQPGHTRALNVMRPDASLKALDLATLGAQLMTYDARKPLMLMPWLLLAAFALLALDALITLVVLSGKAVLARRGARASSDRGGASGAGAGRAAMIAAVALGMAAFMLAGERAYAADGDAKDFAVKASVTTRLAYVVTGDAALDDVSLKGLTGLSRILNSRTAIEPGDPMGVDVEKDELVFFPLLYWPVRPDAKPLSDAVTAKIDAYMKQGGMIIFDTKDYQMPIGTGGLGGQSQALTALIGKLDTPRLEPIPENHVLTRSFYLLRGFPGRWDGGTMWVEAQGAQDEGGERKALKSDGVSSILVTSNDLAGAWALDDDSQPVFAVVPGGETQREMAYRVGVNIVMYALTGNYKADQVHVPALLERLGQ